MPGHAFSIEDALMASRWAEQLASCGYHIAITPGYEDAEEVIEVYINSVKVPAFRVHRTARSVLITDCIGLTSSFPTLADALLVMAPLSKSAEHEMLKGASPAWLPVLATCSTRQTVNRWSHPGRFILSAAKVLGRWHRRLMLKANPSVTTATRNKGEV
jgi:hypothetical protein